MAMSLTFLGTGTSVGVPMIGCHCEVCESPDPRNTRRRTSLLVQTREVAFVIDTPPDFRQQMLDYRVEWLDAVVFTHAHADHILGFDDIRRFNTIARRVMPAYGDPDTIGDVQRIFDYIGSKPSTQGLYRPLVDFIAIEAPFTIGDVTLTPLNVKHGKRMTGYLLESGGVRVGYVPDCQAMPLNTLTQLRGVDVMILDALRYRAHPSHISISESLVLLEEIAAQKSYMIHLCHDVDHARLSATLPAAIAVSYDGLRVEIAKLASGGLKLAETTLQVRGCHEKTVQA